MRGGQRARVAFDHTAFAGAIVAVISAKGVSDREAARQAGVSPSTITRCIRQDHRPDVESLALLADWAGLPVDAFVLRQRPITDTPRVSQVRRIVAAEHAATAAHHALGLLLIEEGP